jgi:Na+/H+ antiporter NhaD/arsenite permease-like protein
MQITANISVMVLATVFVLIAIRQVGRVRLQIWQIMLLGAIAVLLAGEISPIEAFWSINLDVMIFLLSMFIIGEAMQESGYLFRLSNKIFRWAKNPDQLLILIIFGMGFLSAVLMNDTLAIIGTPLMLYFARMHQISSKLLLLALAFAVTTGSVISPIGNPQNLLIAINGDFSNPFQDFFRYLFLPTLINLILAYVILRLVYHDQFKERSVSQDQPPLADEELAMISRISFLLLLVLIILKILVVPLGEADMFNLTYIALLSALPIMIFSHRRFELIRKIDWPTLIFFAAMFVLMESIWRSGTFQQLIAGSNADMTSVPVILALSVLVSQLISNVPFVALYQPLMPGSSINNLMALAAGSTIAGNLFILGAASNVIIIQNAEKAGESLTFLEFARVGIPLTALNIVIYWMFLSKIPFSVI